MKIGMTKIGYSRFSVIVVVIGSILRLQAKRGQCVKHNIKDPAGAIGIFLVTVIGFFVFVVMSATKNISNLVILSRQMILRRGGEDE